MNNQQRFEMHSLLITRTEMIRQRDRLLLKMTRRRVIVCISSSVGDLNGDGATVRETRHQCIDHILRLLHQHLFITLLCSAPGGGSAIDSSGGKRRSIVLCAGNKRIIS